jgi:5'-3' exonuclease
MNVSNLLLGLDGFSLLYLFREERDLFEKYLVTMKHLGSLTFFMDKRAAKEKEEVVQHRKDQRTVAKVAAKTFQEALEVNLDPQQRAVLERVLAEKQRLAWHLYPEYVSWLMNLLETLQIPVVWAEEEADQELAKGGFDIVVSSDSDLLILGVKCLWIPQKTIEHQEIRGDLFRAFLHLEQEEVYQLAFLAGCDWQPKSMMSVGEAVGRLRFYGGLAGIHERHPEIVGEKDLEEYSRLRESVWG